MTYGSTLRDRIAAPGTTPLIGVHDLYSASLAARHYDGMFVSGFGFAASHYGLPDIGFIAWPDMVAFVRRLRGAFPRHDPLVDIDDGYVVTEVACHVVASLERIGALGVVLEDQRRPRRCGHADGKQVLPLDEYLDKLEAVLATRRDLVVVARTDATDEDDIVLRAKALAATGADVVLVDGVRSVEWIRRIRAEAGAKPVLFNQIAGGRSPRLPLGELSALGVDAVVYSTPCLFAAHRAHRGRAHRTQGGRRTARACGGAHRSGGRRVHGPAGAEPAPAWPWRRPRTRCARRSQLNGSSVRYACRGLPSCTSDSW